MNLPVENGEPFAALIKARRYAPNPVARFCTADLKIRAIKEYLVDMLGWENTLHFFNRNKRR